MMNNDLISRGALKDAIENQDKFACLPDTKLVPFHMLNEPEKNYEPYVHLRDIRNAIDNAQAVPQVTVFTETADEKAIADLKAELQSVIEPKPQGDLISRSALKEQFKDLFALKALPILQEKLLGIIDNTPTIPLPDFKAGYKQAIIDGKANYSRPQGEWINPSENPEFSNREFFYDCSICGNTQMDETNFCPNCGADMWGGAKNERDCK